MGGGPRPRTARRAGAPRTALVGAGGRLARRLDDLPGLSRPSGSLAGGDGGGDRGGSGGRRSVALAQRPFLGRAKGGGHPHRDGGWRAHRRPWGQPQSNRVSRRDRSPGDLPASGNGRDLRARAVLRPILRKARRPSRTEPLARSRTALANVRPNSRQAVPACRWTGDRRRTRGRRWTAFGDRRHSGDGGGSTFRWVETNRPPQVEAGRFLQTNG